MQATGAGNHQRKVILFWGWFAIDPPIKSGTSELGNDFVPPLLEEPPNHPLSRCGLGDRPVTLPIALAIGL
jgi:hypothetical protein